MTIPVPLLDLPFDGSLSGTNAVTGSLTANTEGTVIFGTPNHDSSGGYAGVGDPDPGGGGLGGNIYPDPGFENQESAWITSEGDAFTYFNNFNPTHGGSWMLNAMYSDSSGVNIISTDTGLGLPGTTPVHVSYWGNMGYIGGSDSIEVVGRVIYDDASHDDTPMATVDTPSPDDATFAFVETDLTVDSGKTIDAIQVRMTGIDVEVAFGLEYHVDDLAIDIPEAEDPGPPVPEPGKLSLPTAGNITTAAGAIAFWVQADRANYWDDDAAVDFFPLLTITTASGEADRVAIEWDLASQSVMFRTNDSLGVVALMFAADDLDWHLFLLNYDAGHYELYVDNAQKPGAVSALLPADGDIYLLSSPYHDRAGGHISNLTTFSDMLTPAQRQYLWDGSPIPPPPRIGGLMRTDAPPIVSVERTSTTPLLMSRSDPPESIVIDRTGVSVPLALTRTQGEV